MVAGLVPFGLAQSGERFQDGGDFRGAGAGEVAGDGFGRDRGGRLHQIIADGADAFGEVRRPGEAAGAGGRLLFLFHLHAEAGLSAGGLLKFGAEPADQAGAFFGGTGIVEFDEAEENILGGEIGLPAVGGGDGGIEIVVEVAQNRYEAADRESSGWRR